MELHTGAIVERVVRRSGVSITELARRTHVNRRSVYNWFNQKRLKLDIICKIGNVLGHDFSAEFPNFFPKDQSPVKRLVEQKEEVDDSENVYYWMNKYISLLEKYNELLLKASQRDANKDGKAEEIFEKSTNSKTYSEIPNLPVYNSFEL